MHFPERALPRGTSQNAHTLKRACHTTAQLLFFCLRLKITQIARETFTIVKVVHNVEYYEPFFGLADLTALYINR